MLEAGVSHVEFIYFCNILQILFGGVLILYDILYLFMLKIDLQ